MSTDLEVVADPAAVAQRGAEVIADRARSAVDDRGAFSLAVSGGHTPVAMFAALAISTCRGTRSRSTRSTSGSRPRATTNAI